MRAIQVTAFGGPEVLELADVDAPVVEAGQLLVDVEAAGINYMDTYQRAAAGNYGLTPPFTLGVEGAGMVSAVGEGVEGISRGDRVAWKSGRGSYAEQVRVAAREAVPVPSGIDSDTAAALMMQALTAHYLVNSTYPVAEGDWVVVHAAAGGVGLLLTQLAKLRGGRVIGTVSTAEKEALAREAGADEVIRYTEAPIAATVREITGGEGAAVVYDAVGKTTFDESLASLRKRGYMVLYGASSGAPAPLDMQRLNSGGSLFATRPTLVDYTRTRDELLARADEIFSLAQAGKLRARIGHRYPLEEARTAHEDLEGRRTTGKLLLLPH